MEKLYAVVFVGKNGSYYESRIGTKMPAGVIPVPPGFPDSSDWFQFSDDCWYAVIEFEEGGSIAGGTVIGVLP